MTLLSEVYQKAFFQPFSRRAHYGIIADNPHGRYLLEDQDAQPVAILWSSNTPVVFAAADGQWELSVSTLGRGWSLAARPIAADLSAVATPTLLPNTFTCLLSSRRRMRVGPSLLTGTWRIGRRAQTLVSLPPAPTFAADSALNRRNTRIQVGEIITSSQAASPPELAVTIAILLALFRHNYRASTVAASGYPWG